MQVGPIDDLAAWAHAARARIGDRLIVCSVSGGKDSTAMALLLQEAEIPFLAVHMDTGWEQKETYKYVREYLPRVIGDIHIIEGQFGGMQGLVEARRGFPGPGARFCTGELKVRPMQRFLRALEDEPVNTVGIRAEESRRRRGLSRWEYSDTMDCDVWRPIIDWTTADVVNMHRRHGVRPNPLYLMGASRVGCWPCIYARKAEVRMIADFDPGRIDEIRYLEQRVDRLRAERAAERGMETYRRQTWFGYRREGWGIDDVVRWSRGSGPEILDAPLHEQGCMRWGMCETMHPIDAQAAEMQALWAAESDD